MKTKNFLLGLALTSPMAGNAVKPVPVEKKPNVVIFFIDDMGYSDISCYGQKKWKTPNIDQLAENGIRFTDAYSASPICSPSRAGLLTGRYPARMGIQQVFFPGNYTGIPQKELLISELLKTAGYTTGIIGKWHLGSREKFLPLQNGFDEYFGIPYSNDMAEQVYLRGNDVVQYHIDQSHMTKKYTEEAISFIDRHKDQPFFLELAHNMMHVPIFCSPEFRGKSGAGLYGDAVLEVDWSIGQVMAELKKQGLMDNTLVIFSSDNGPWLQEGPLGGEAKPLREGKTTSYEGGVRVPLIAYWKGKIKPRTDHDVVRNLDWFPTLTDICGVAVPDSIRLDGYDISGVLLRGEKSPGNVYAYFRNNKDVTSLRVGDWKITLPQDKIVGNFWRASTAAHDTLLFNLKNDPSETTDLFHKYPEKAKEMTKAIETYKANFGPIPPALVVWGNDQRRELQQQRHKAIEDAKKRGVKSKKDEVDGFIEAK